jgi:hypothetical protein
VEELFPGSLTGQLPLPHRAGPRSDLSASKQRETIYLRIDQEKGSARDKKMIRKRKTGLGSMRDSGFIKMIHTLSNHEQSVASGPVSVEAKSRDVPDPTRTAIHGTATSLMPAHDLIESADDLVSCPRMSLG